jgi:DNA-binding transcriptional ArsR family regulator
MLSTAALAETAALIGEPARAAMLTSLMDGRALTATELARAAGITAQTASGHLARLTEAGLLAMERQGRHRYHRLGSAAVAQMLESMMSVAAGARPKRVVTGPRQAALRQARTCFDHLAGVLAVAIADRMVERRHVELGADGGRLTDEGSAFLAGLGIDPQPGSKRRGAIFCRPCLDWSERRPHIAGQVGAALCRACLDRDWVRRVEGSRALTISPAGRLALDQAFGIRAVQNA